MGEDRRLPEAKAGPGSGSAARRRCARQGTGRRRIPFLLLVRGGIPREDAERAELEGAWPVPDALREDLPPMARMEAFGRYLFQEDHLPVATALRVGVDGSVWVGVEGTNAETERWWVLDEELRPIAGVRVPGELELQQVARDRIWVIERDELDVPYVVVYGLVEAS